MAEKDEIDKDWKKNLLWFSVFIFYIPVFWIFFVIIKTYTNELKPYENILLVLIILPFIFMIIIGYLMDKDWKKKYKSITSDIIEVNVEILKHGVKISNENLYRLLPWNEITGKVWSFNLVHWSWVFYIRIKKSQRNTFLPVSKNKDDLLELRNKVWSNWRRYKKGLEIMESKINGPLKLKTTTIIKVDHDG